MLISMRFLKRTFDCRMQVGGHVLASPVSAPPARRRGTQEGRQEAIKELMTASFTFILVVPFGFLIVFRVVCLIYYDFNWLAIPVFDLP